MSHFSVIPGEKVQEAWHIVRPVLQKAIDATDGRFNELSVMIAVQNGDMQLWFAGDETETAKVAVVTQIIDYPCQRYGVVLFCGGEGLELCQTYIGAIEEWFQRQGCHVVEIIGRPGWGKALDGYKRKSWVFAKRVQ